MEGLFEMFTTDKNNKLNGFITTLKNYKDEDEDVIDLTTSKETISKVLGNLGFSSEKIVTSALGVAAAATTTKNRLETLISGLKTPVSSYNSENQLNGRIKVEVEDKDNVAKNAEFYYSYENPTLVSDNLKYGISVKAIAIEENKNLKVQIIKSNTKASDTLVPIGDNNYLENRYNTAQSMQVRYKKEPIPYEVPIIRWDSYNNYRFKSDDVEKAIDTREEFEMSKLYDYMVENNLDVKKPVFMKQIINPKELNRKFELKTGIRNYKPVLIKYNTTGKKFEYRGAGINMIRGNNDLETGTYFIVSARSVICLTSKANILTPNGYINIKKLKKGHNVITSNNKIVEILRIIKIKLLPPEDNLPYLVPAASLGKNYPPKDITISGKHAILMPNKKDWFIPNFYKEANKNKVKPIEVDGPITYYHIILPSYIEDNLVINGGCIVESCGRSRDNVYFEKKYNGLFKRKQKIIKYKKIFVNNK
jgi:hypothetical protein